MEERRATRPKESRVPFLIFLLIVTFFLCLRTMIFDDPFARLRAIQTWPVVEASSRNLVDECGVFMWTKWQGPGFGTDEPYIPMRYRYQR